MFKKIASLFLVTLVALSMSACRNVQFSFGPDNMVRGSGNVIDETREVSGFDFVSISNSGQATISVGDTESLVITAEDNILPLIQSNVSQWPAGNRRQAEQQLQHHARHQLQDHGQVAEGR